MKIALTVLVMAVAGISVWFWYDHRSLMLKLAHEQTGTATTSAYTLQLASCLAQAETDYDQKWNSLCQKEGQSDYCNEFVGSPRDVQFTQIKDQEKAICASLYK